MRKLFITTALSLAALASLALAAGADYPTWCC
jgi:hypothetical protein